MKNILNPLRKIDNRCRDLLTNYIRKWIKKNNYEKHKIDFAIKIEEYTLWVLVVFAVVLTAVLYFIEGKIFSGSFHAFVWLLMAGFQYVRILKMKYKDKPLHDLMFSMRKDPRYYEMEKQVIEHVFIAHRKRRVSFIAFHTFITIWIVVSLGALTFFGLSSAINMTLIYLVFGWITTIIQMYIIYVFDFDEPEEKKKVAKESISEIFLRAWQNLIGGFSPQPNYG